MTTKSPSQPDCPQMLSSEAESELPGFRVATTTETRARADASPDDRAPSLLITRRW